MFAVELHPDNWPEAFVDNAPITGDETEQMMLTQGAFAADYKAGSPSPNAAEPDERLNSMAGAWLRAVEQQNALTSKAPASVLILPYPMELHMPKRTKPFCLNYRFITKKRYACILLVTWER